MAQVRLGTAGAPVTPGRSNEVSRCVLVLAVGALSLGIPGAGCAATDSASSSDGSCVPNETQACFGPSRCEGSQSCLEDGSGFTECECGDPVTETDGTSHRGGSSGDGGTGNRGAVGGTRASGGTGPANGTAATTATGGGAGYREEPGGARGRETAGGSGFEGEPPLAETGEALAVGAGGTAGVGEAATGGVAGGWGCNESGMHAVNVAVQTEVRTLDFDEATIDVFHKRDIDPQAGGGCVGRVSISLTENGECLLSLGFNAVASGSALWLESAVLVVDSECPGWSDSQAGWYELASAPNSATLDLSDEVVDDGSSYGSCLTATLRPSGVITLERQAEAGQVRIDLSSIQITDAFGAWGDDNLCCPGDTCAGGGAGAGGGGH